MRSIRHGVSFVMAASSGSRHDRLVARVPGGSRLAVALAAFVLASCTANTSTPGSAASVAASPGPPTSSGRYLSGLDATAVTRAVAAYHLTCRQEAGGFSGNAPTEQAWSCLGPAADGSDLMASLQGPSDGHIELATAEVLEYRTVKVGTITDFLGAMVDLFGNSAAGQGRSWLLTALPIAQRDGHVEADLGANHYTLTFEDNGNSSTTYLQVEPLR